MEQLKTWLNKDSHNSHNSHKPPSSDGPTTPPRPRSLRKHSGKPSGGQDGHPGGTRVLVDDPNVVVVHAPAVCAGCGASLETAPAIGRERRQLVEIAAPNPTVTEHQASTKAVRSANG